MKRLKIIMQVIFNSGRFFVGIMLLTTMFFFLFATCSKNKTDQLFNPTPYEIEIPYGFPTILNIPVDNPMTVEGVELGRYLFYDGRLSGRTHQDSMMSCATCHIQNRAFECGADHHHFSGGFTFGLTGKYTHHVMLSLINLVWNSNGYLWNGGISKYNPDIHARNLEDIVWMAVIAEDEIAGDTTRTKQLISSITGYPDLFFKAFGSKEITMERISKAIAQFVRTLVSANSKFDHYLRGEYQLTAEELRGFVLFTTEEGADCFHCHGGGGNPLFTTNLFYNNGKDDEFDDLYDRYSITNNPVDIGAYKAPTLRNVELTGPYMHDGRFSSLEEVIEFYSHQVKNSPYINPLMHHVANGGTQLTPSEKTDLMAFIKTLRDDDFLNNPNFSRPSKFPDEQ